jgi:type I restriction enzyme, S subunit
MIKVYEKYKDSGIEWLGEIPEHWIVGALKHSFKFKVGFTPPTANPEFYDEDGFEWVTISDLENKYVSTSKNKISKKAVDVYSKEIVPKGSLLYSFKLSVGKVAFADKDIFTNEAIFSILPDENLELSFYYYCLPALLIHNANHNIYGAKIFNQDVIKNSKLPIPPYTEQTQIANFLDHQTNIIDDLIGQKEKLITLLKEKRQAIINEVVTKGLNPNVKMKDSGVEWLGEVPVEWKIVKLRYLNNKIGSGVTPKGGAEVYVEEGVVFVRSQNVHFDGLRLDDVVKIEPEIHKKMSGSKVHYNDVLLNITGASIGRCCVVDINEEMNVNQHVCIIRPNERIKSYYLNLVLQSTIGQTQIRLGITGGNREGLNFEAIKDFIILLPDVDTQLDILNYTNELIAQIRELESKSILLINKLKDYRQSLISEVVTGKIDVRDWKPKTN